jgi:phytoene synthase
MAERLRVVDRIAPEDLDACRTLLRGGSRSFFAASLLLPRRVMEPATALYAFCRVADDLIDGPQGAGALGDLRHRLDLVYAGRPADHAADRALARVVGPHRLPRALLEALLEGFAWDAEGRQYDDLAAIQAYAARVAGAVGAMMAVLMGVRSADLVARACDLGVAMQLSNIARDVGEDAASGRLYLPRRWLREAGIDPDAWLARPAFTPALGGVVQRLVTAADTLYSRADAGIAGLPLDCRPGIGAARRLYAAIGHRVAAAGGNSVDRRAVVPFGIKIGLLAQATGAALLPSGPATAAPLPATRYLVASAAPDPAPVALGRLEWLLNLFADLDQRQGAASAERTGA